jgi:uncharacterized membrane protein
MTDGATENAAELRDAPVSRPRRIFPFLAAVVALAGLADAVYLTIHHYTGENVPCSITGGCELVLTSSYATIAGIPLSLFGAAAYFIAFSLAILTAFGNRAMWKLFGILATLMALFSILLTFIQAFGINNQVPFVERFCQFCLLSALTSFTLFIIALISKFWKK